MPVAGREFVSEWAGGAILIAMLVGASLAVAAVAAVLGATTAVKGAYAPIGLLFATVSYFLIRVAPTSWSGRDAPVRHWWTIRRFGPRLVGLAAVCSVGIAVVTGNRALGLLVGLPVGFGLLAGQMVADVGARTLLAQAVALYLASSTTKYLTNGFYYGGGDTFYHVRSVETLVRTGSVAALPRYEFFPGFHLLAGALSMLGGIPAYDAILVTGIATYGVVVMSVFALVRAATGNKRLGAVAAIGLVMVEPFLYYATYFFPQSLAVALVVFGLYAAYRANRERDARLRFTLVGLALMATLVVTHQLTIVLFVPIVGMVFAVTYALRRVESRRSTGYTHSVWPRGYLAAVVGLAAISYWAYRSEFLAELASSVRTVASFGLLTGDSGAPTPTYALGTDLPALTTETAVRGLFSTGGIYQITLVAVFALGVAAVIDRTRTHWSVLPLFAVGTTGAVVMFRTPLTVPGLVRIQLPIAAFFAVVLGVGLYRLSRSVRSRTALAVLVVLVAAVGTTAPLNTNAGDDLYTLNAGPDLYELYPTPEPQREFSTSEYRDFESTAAFVERHETPVYTFSIGSQAMQGFGVESEGATANKSGIVMGEGLFLYRQRFVEHRVSYAVEQGGGIAIGTVVITPDWLDAALATQHKVYASGRAGLLWNPNGSLVAPNPQTTQAGASNDRSGSRRLITNPTKRETRA